MNVSLRRNSPPDRRAPATTCAIIKSAARCQSTALPTELPGHWCNEPDRVDVPSGKRGIKASNALIVKNNYPRLLLSFSAALASLRLTQDRPGRSIYLQHCNLVHKQKTPPERGFLCCFGSPGSPFFTGMTSGFARPGEREALAPVRSTVRLFPREASGTAADERRDCVRSSGYISIPPMPPMPPPCPWPPIAGSSFGSSATIASVVRMRLATEAAFCSAVRATLVGSNTPICTRSPYSPDCAL